MNTIVLKGEPKSTSHIYKITCRGRFASMYLSAQGKAIKIDYGWQIRQQWKKQPLKGNVEIIIALYFGTKRKCDWDNFHKLSMDAMTGLVYVDDSQIIRATVEKFYEKGNGRIEIDVYELD